MELVNGPPPSTRSHTSRHSKRRCALRVSAPGRSPSSVKIWNPLQIPSTGPPLFAKLTPEASEKLRKGNYERLFDEARRKVRAWEKAEAKAASERASRP